jgi:hypothetical protein
MSKVSRSAQAPVFFKARDKAALGIIAFINHLPVAGHRDYFWIIKDSVSRFPTEIWMHQIVIVKHADPGGLRSLRECTPGVFQDRNRSRQAEKT